MKLVTKYQISAINNCWEKCDEKCAYMFNVYKSQLSRKTGSRNLTGPKTLPTIWGTYMKVVTKYQISAINSSWEKCDEKYLGTDGRKEIKQYTPLRWSGGIKICIVIIYTVDSRYLEFDGTMEKIWVNRSSTQEELWKYRKCSLFNNERERTRAKFWRAKTSIADSRNDLKLIRCFCCCFFSAKFFESCGMTDNC